MLTPLNKNALVQLKDVVKKRQKKIRIEVLEGGSFIRKIPLSLKKVQKQFLFNKMPLPL